MFKNFFNCNYKSYNLESRTPSLELDETIPYQKNIKEVLKRLDSMQIEISNDVKIYNYNEVCDCSYNCECLDVLKNNNKNIKLTETNNRSHFMNILTTPVETPRESSESRES